MKKMTKCLTVLTAAVLMFAFAGQAGAFCVHNMSDRTMKVYQVSGGKFLKGFSATLASTESACCNWQNQDCNTMGGTVGRIEVDVSKVVDGWFDEYVCQNVRVMADGDLYIYKKNNGYVCGDTLPPFPPPPPPPVIK